MTRGDSEYVQFPDELQDKLSLSDFPNPRKCLRSSELFWTTRPNVDEKQAAKSQYSDAILGPDEIE